MQTVYLLAGCKDSSNALYKLRRSPDMTTLIVVVPKSQKKLITLDKRVKTFPFIINTPPTRQGLIPKRAVVMSFGKAVKVSQGILGKFRNNNYTQKKQINRYKSRIVNIPSVSSSQVVNVPNKVRNDLSVRLPRQLKQPMRIPRQLKPSRQVVPQLNKKIDFSIRKVKNCDGHTLILEKN